MKGSITNELNLNNLQDLIVVRSEPHIYAFSTNTIPNYIKIGDTFRPINKRLEEWRTEYKDLKRLFPDVRNEKEGLAKVNDNIYFRDYSLHEYLVKKNYKRLDNTEFKQQYNNVYYSNEFFEKVPVDEIKKGIQDIKDNYQEESRTYTYYKMKDKTPDRFYGKNDKDWKLRENQREVVDNFISKVDEEKELLMYAVMRFGKSFTSLYAAYEKQYKKVLIVSAKADVAGEWKKTVETPKCFKDYGLLMDDDFVKNPNIIENIINKKSTDEYFKDKNSVVVFLTLQNLSGKSNKDDADIKEKLEKVFETNFDMIIIDETHYGAWADIYGSVLKDSGNSITNDEDKKYIENQIEEQEDFVEKTKTLKSNVKLHLSGTPYKLLYDEKFSKKNLISSVQFSDILRDKEEWYENHKKLIDNGDENPETGLPYQEYDNPYFGFPKMLRFAFNLPEKTQKELYTKFKDKKWSLNHLFEINKKRNKETAFLYENQILNLLNVIDGTEEDDSVLSFLDIPKIKDNDVSKHIVMVLPFKYSCDAMENLINKNKNNFKNLKEYKILNITGHNLKKDLDDIDKVKHKIAEYESKGIKTITLTVNKMLTGVTVPQWDTMIMLKNTKSPQEYDQSVFRIQNQYVKEVVADDGDVIKIDMKPQTILVDFDPSRMFELQGLSTRIVNSVTNADENYSKSVETELKYFPIITYNANKLVQVSSSNIVEIVTKYNKDKSITDEAKQVPFDESIFSNSELFNYINSQSEKGIGSSKLQGSMHEGNGEFSDFETATLDDIASENNDQDEDIEDSARGHSQTTVDKRDNKIKKKYESYISKLLFYSFLTKSNVEKLRDIINSVENESEHQSENIRIFSNLGLNLDAVKEHLESGHRLVMSELDNKITTSNLLSRDSSLSDEERIESALNRFARISESEIVTPPHICNEMLESIGKKNLKKIVNKNGRILDIASKTGEFAVALFNMLKKEVNINKLKGSIYSIPTSSVTYEFTRKIYEILGFPLSNIATEFYSYDLLNIKKIDDNGKETKEIDYDKINKLLMQHKNFNAITLNDNIEGEIKMIKFDAIVGNPPYQVKGGSGGNNDAPIYQSFADISHKLNPKYASLIIPARWFAAGRENLLGGFRREMLNDSRIKVLKTFLNAADVFENVEIKGGVCYYLLDDEYDGKCEYLLVRDDELIKSKIKLNKFDLFIREPMLSEIVEKVTSINNGLETVDSIISNDTPFGISSNPKTSKKNPLYVSPTFSEDYNITLYHIEKSKRKIEYVKKSDIKKNSEDIKFHKVFIPGSGGSGNDAIVLGYPETAPKNSVCSQSYLYAKFNTKEESINFTKYIKSKFLRTMVMSIKITQSAPKRVYQFVPMQDFTNNSDIDWSKSISDIDKQLYKKYKLTQQEVDFIESMIKPM